MKLTQEEEDKLDDSILKFLEEGPWMGSPAIFDLLFYNMRLPKSVFSLEEQRRLVHQRCLWLYNHGFIVPEYEDKDCCSYFNRWSVVR